MDTLVLKLILTPVLIGGASLAGRRWGPAVSGWLVGLPLTSGPIAFFLALSHGAGFAAGTADGILAGTMSQAAFCLAYGWLARYWSWPPAIAAGCLTFGAATAALRFVALPAAPLFVIVVATLLCALCLMPARSVVTAVASAPPRWDLLARMTVATAFVVLLTAVAPALGPRLTGLLAPFPLYASILAVFAHRTLGSAAANNVLRGLLLGLFAFAGFFLALATLLVPLGIGPAFIAAAGGALVLQSGSLWVLRRSQRRSCPDQRETEL